MTDPIPFNRPFIAGRELQYIAESVAAGNIGGDGRFGRRCSEFLERTFGIHRVLMTTSATAALEMAAILCDFEPTDEVIMPSFTFVSTANAVVRAGARVVFAEIREDTLNLDERSVEASVTGRTRAVFPVHYAGVGCEMDEIMSMADRHELFVVEDAAQAVNAAYKSRPLGGIGHLGAFSFHETKNYICGEGGALAVNRPEFLERALVVRDKGTNRQRFFRGEVDKYSWVDIGGSYAPSEIVCAFLFGQLEQLAPITRRRREIFEFYRQALEPLAEQGHLRLPHVPAHCQSNDHLFYILAEDGRTRDALLDHLRERQIHAVFHYVPLHASPMGRRFGYREGQLPITESVSARLLRLPMFHEITRGQQRRVVDAIVDFF